MIPGLLLTAVYNTSQVDNGQTALATVTPHVIAGTTGHINSYNYQAGVHLVNQVRRHT